MERATALVRRKEASQILGISRGTIRKLVECGTISMVHLQKDRRGRPKGYGYFRRADLHKMLSE